MAPQEAESVEQAAQETENQDIIPATGETDEENPQPEEGVPPQAPRKQTAQERIDEITRKRREAEREMEYWKKVALNKGESDGVEKHTPVPAAPPDVTMPVRPKFEDFETQEQYEDALLSYWDERRNMQTMQQKREADFNAAVSDFNSRADKFRMDHDDFDDVINRPVFSNSMKAAILQSESGPELAYHLGNNRELADRIRGMTPDRQIFELGKLETQLAVTRSTRKVPTTPEPIEPVGIGGGEEKDPSKMTTAEWIAWDRAKQIEKLKNKNRIPGT